MFKINCCLTNNQYLLFCQLINVELDNVLKRIVYFQTKLFPDNYLLSKGYKKLCYRYLLLLGLKESIELRAKFGGDDFE